MRPSFKNVLKFGAAAMGVAAALVFSLYAAQHDVVVDLVARFGHVGALTAGFVSGFNVIVPVPAITLLPLFVAAGLSIPTSVVLLTIGMTFGDGVGYLIGFLGRESLKITQKMEKVSARVTHYQKKYPALVPLGIVVYAAFIPLPNELVVVPLSALGYKIRLIAPLIFAGNLVFNTLGAFAITGLFAL